MQNSVFNNMKEEQILIFPTHVFVATGKPQGQHV